jgi:glycosyltransferase involved in cell wall biosynthesis
MYKVSVTIPAFNVETYIEKSVRSVLNQTLEEIEVIVVNDGSSDQTLKIVKSINDSRLKIIDQPNLGVSKARNAGISAATGEYLFQLDGDDWIEPTALMDMYQEAVKNSSDIVITDAFVDDEIRVGYFAGANSLSGDSVKDLLLGNISANVWTKMYKRSLLTENNIFYDSRITIGEDLLINLVLFHKAKKVFHLQRAYVHYMQRQVSLTKVYNEKLLQVYTMQELIYNFLKENSLFEKYQKDFECLEYQHTYYYRIMVDTKSRKIHRGFYERGMTKYDEYLKNPLIVNFINTRPKGEQKLEKLFRYNYSMACMRLRLIKYFHMFD